MAEYICPKCKEKACVVQSITGRIQMLEFDVDKKPIEVKDGDDMQRGRYTCYYCAHSSWVLEDMLVRVR